MRAKLFRRSSPIFLLLLLLAVLIQGCIFRRPAQTKHYFEIWSNKHRDDVIDYQAFLNEKDLGDTVPMSQLLKSARDWKKCKAEPFTMPPKVLWPNLVPTLLLVKKFKSEGVLINPIAASVYRDPTLNVCAGGSPNSRHLKLNAIDFDIEVTADSLNSLCDAWRNLGPELSIGLGFYTPSRIHLDTMGYRSWGSDHTHKTSLCLQQN